MPQKTSIPLIKLVDNPFVLFAQWLKEAERSEKTNHNAMILATSTPDGHPSCRVVLLKNFDERGFVFYTNEHSRKGKELKANPHVSLLFYWKETERQIRIEGDCYPTTAAESDKYFATRRRLSKIGAIASKQSDILRDRAVFEGDIQKLSEKYPTENVPRPANWHGYRVCPKYFEFWQERPYRLHDRGFYKLGKDGKWQTGRLYP